MKPPVGAFPDPTTGQEAVTKAFADATYAGGGPIAAAQGDYLVATLSAAQNNVTAAGTPIAFDRVDDSRGSRISLDVSGNVGRLTLLAGHTYLLSCRIHFGTGSGAARLHQLWNVTDNAAVPGADTQIWNASAAGTVGGPQGLTIPLAPSVDTEYEVRMMGSSDTDYSADWTGITVTEIGAVQADVVGGLEFMDIIDVVADQTSVLFGAAGDGAFQRALDGDVDETYVLQTWFPDPVSSPGFELRPNSLAPGGAGFSIAQSLGGTGVINATTATWQISGQSTGTEESGEFEFKAESGRKRFLTGQTGLFNAGSGRWTNTYAGKWDDTATNITSLQIFASVASAIKIGARFVLWRKTRNNLRADSAAVYERHAMETVDPGALATTERTVGHTIYGGSLVGVSLRVENAVTAGTITCNVKVDGVTKLTAVLDTTNSTSRVVRAAIGTHKFAADQNVSVEFVPTSYDNTGSVPSPVTVQVHLTNDALINAPAPNPYPPSHLDGLNMAWNSISLVDILPGTARDSTNADNIDVTATLTADITASGANGLDTGSEAANTWYALYVIDSPNDVPAALLSTSFTSPTLPGTYTSFRRVGAVRNMTTDLRKFWEVTHGKEREILWDTFNEDGLSLNAGESAAFVDVDCSQWAPEGAGALRFYHSYLNNSSLQRFFEIRRKGASVADYLRRPSVLNTTTQIATSDFLACDSGQIVEYKLSVASPGAHQLSLYVIGYRDTL
jgi:hypothetical protein